MIAIPITHYISRRHLMDLQGDEQKSAQTYLAELEKFKKGIEATFAKEGMMLLAYEVFAGWIGGNGDGNSPAAVDRQDWERRQHMITQLVAIPNELLPMIESMFREAADREQFDVSEDGSLPEDINTPYFHLDVPVLEGDDGESSKTTSVPRRKRLVFVPNDERTSRAFEEYADQKMQHQSRRRNPGAAGWMNLRFGSQVVAELLGRPDRADWKKWVKEKDEETAITKTWQKKLKPVLQ